MSFGEEPLTTPVVVARTSDKCHPTRLDIRGNEKIIRVEYKSGTGTGAGFTEHSTGNVTLSNEVLPETGEPDPDNADWDDLIRDGKQLATWVRAQPDAVTTLLLLKKIADTILAKKGVI